MKRVYGALFLAASFSAAASAGCIGVCGTDGPNGDVVMNGVFTQYNYVTTTGGVTGGGTIDPLFSSPTGLETNGSTEISSAFFANGATQTYTGDVLSFNFNYVTSDGAGYADYGWAALLSCGNDPTCSAPTGTANSGGGALLFTATTEPSGNVVPAPDLAPTSAGVLLTPPTSAIYPGSGGGTYPCYTTCSGYPDTYPDGDGPDWNELGGWSGSCYSTGCGLTGWINATYAIQSTGYYELEYGVTNAIDTNFDTGLAVDGVTIAGQNISLSGTPEPATFALFGLGLGALGLIARRRKV